jgi:hypothetical protein
VILAMTRVSLLARRGRLDRELAAGVDPHGDEALEHRAAQLECPAARRQLATGLERVLQAADEPPVTFSASAPLNRPAIRAARPVLLALARELRRNEQARAQGVALVRRLLVDGAGPLYAPAPTEELAEAAAAALETLAVGPPLRMTA